MVLASGTPQGDGRTNWRLAPANRPGQFACLWLWCCTRCELHRVVGRVFNPPTGHADSLAQVQMPSAKGEVGGRAPKTTFQGVAAKGEAGSLVSPASGNAAGGGSASAIGASIAAAAGSTPTADDSMAETTLPSQSAPEPDELPPGVNSQVFLAGNLSIRSMAKGGLTHVSGTPPP
jgi:hypothetical protein